jgi:hypothetical protein
LRAEVAQQQRELGRLDQEIARLDREVQYLALLAPFLLGAGTGYEVEREALRDLTTRRSNLDNHLEIAHSVDVPRAVAKLDVLRKLAADPPDPNFRVLAQPSVPPVQPVAPGPGVSPLAAEAWTAKAINDVQVLGVARALLQSVERAQGAAAAGDARWLQQQQQAAGRFAAQLAALLDHEIVVRVRLRDALVLDGGVAPPPTPWDVAFAQALGLSPPEIQTLALLGLDPASIVALQADLRAGNPFEAVLMGPFPLSVTNPLLINALQETASAMGAFASANGQAARLPPPPVTQLLPPLVPPPPRLPPPPPPTLGLLPGVPLTMLPAAPVSLDDGRATEHESDPVPARQTQGGSSDPNGTPSP